MSNTRCFSCHQIWMPSPLCSGGRCSEEWNRTLSDCSLKIPIRVRMLKSATPEHGVESLNVSTHGIGLATNLPLREGAPVQVIFEMPKEVTNKPASEWRCTGHVVHVLKKSSPQGAICVGVAFACYEVLPVAQTSVSQTP